jgi:NTE family protein
MSEKRRAIFQVTAIGASGLSVATFRICCMFLLGLWLVACASVPAELVVSHPPQAMPLKPAVGKKRFVIGIALGGGVTRGFAHVGVLNTLEKNGIIPDVMAATSAGSVVGVLYAAGIRGERLEEAAVQLHRDQVVDWSYSGRGFIRGELLQDYINNATGNRSIESLQPRFAATATDLDSGELVVFTQGDAGIAVRASSSIPGLVSPVRINGRDYVDGGLVSKVPVQVAKQMGADLVIAVDVSRTPHDHPALDSALAVMQQAYAIMSQAVLEKDLQLADVIIRPEIGIISLGDFDQKEQAISAGERAALAALPKIKRLLKERESGAE